MNEQGVDLQPYYVRCPCKRGYMKQFCITSENAPMAFAIGNGYLLMQGNCDACDAIIQWACPLADLTFNEDFEWDSQVTIIGRQNE